LSGLKWGETVLLGFTAYRYKRRAVPVRCGPPPFDRPLSWLTLQPQTKGATIKGLGCELETQLALIERTVVEVTVTTASVPGPPAQPVQYVVAAGPQYKNGLGTAALVCGIVGLVFALIPIIGIFFGLILGILAIVFGAIGISRVNRNVANNRGSAVAGLVIGIIAFVLAIIAWTVIYAAADSLNNSLDHLDSVNANSTAFQHAQNIVDNKEHTLISRGEFIGNW
jgi:hypothetical protein